MTDWRHLFMIEGMRIAAAALALGLVAAPTTPLAAPPDPAASAPDLAAAVRARVPGGEVTIARSNVEWGFGTAVRMVAGEEYPDGWLFVAHREQGRWRVALEGEPQFATLSGDATILSGDERRTLGDRTEGTDRRTGMRLPFAIGQTWRYTGGPHPMSGGARSSIDLAGGDGRVLAARGGLAYTMCRSGKGWVRVVHDRGLATDYYHLEGNIRPNGTRVAEGAFLGNIGNDVSCGGRSSGKHVHFSLRRDGQYVEIDRHAFGKWVIIDTGRAYSGAARHGSEQVAVGGSLRNYGALGLTQGIVDTDGGSTLNRRAGPGIAYAVAGTVADGDTVTIACSARGTTHTGRDGYTSDLWNKLTDGSWVSDVYVWTGTGDPVNGFCTKHG